MDQSFQKPIFKYLYRNLKLLLTLLGRKREAHTPRLTTSVTGEPEGRCPVNALVEQTRLWRESACGRCVGCFPVVWEQFVA